MFRDFETRTIFLKTFCPLIWKSLHVLFNPSQSVSSIYCLVMVTSEKSIACKCFKKGNVGDSRSNLTYGQSYKIIKIRASFIFPNSDFIRSAEKC